MYFEPSKKSYYRFPSTNINEIDNRYYYQEAVYQSIEHDIYNDFSSSNNKTDHSMANAQTY